MIVIFVNTNYNIHMILILNKVSDFKIDFEFISDLYLSLKSIILLYIR